MRLVFLVVFSTAILAIPYSTEHRKLQVRTSPGPAKSPSPGGQRKKSPTSSGASSKRSGSSSSEGSISADKTKKKMLTEDRSSPRAASPKAPSNERPTRMATARVGLGNGGRIYLDKRPSTSQAKFEHHSSPAYRIIEGSAMATATMDSYSSGQAIATGYKSVSGEVTTYPDPPNYTGPKKPAGCLECIYPPGNRSTGKINLQPGRSHRVSYQNPNPEAGEMTVIATLDRGGIA